MPGEHTLLPPALRLQGLADLWAAVIGVELRAIALDVVRAAPELVHLPVLRYLHLLHRQGGRALSQQVKPEASGAHGHGAAERTQLIE